MMCEIFKDEKGVLRARWRCPLCARKWDFHASAAKDIGFFVVYHLVAKHGLRPNEVLRYDARLADAMREYLGNTQLMSRVANTPTHPLSVLKALLSRVSPVKTGGSPGGRCI